MPITRARAPRSSVRSRRRRCRERACDASNARTSSLAIARSPSSAAPSLANVSCAAAIAAREPATINRVGSARANAARVKARALELYHTARGQRQENIRAFEAEYGRADRIDYTVLADLQRIQARLAAIAARQQRANATGGEPKVAKFVVGKGAFERASIRGRSGARETARIKPTVHRFRVADETNG